MDIKLYFVGTSVWTTILIGQIQNRSEFEIERRKTRRFPLKIENSFPTLRGQHLHLLVSKACSLKLLA